MCLSSLRFNLTYFGNKIAIVQVTTKVIKVSRSVYVCTKLIRYVLLFQSEICLVTFEVNTLYIHNKERSLDAF